MASKEMVGGELRWTDRYTVCLFGCPTFPELLNPEPREIIIHKGQIVLLYRDDD